MWFRGHRRAWRRPEVECRGIKAGLAGGGPAWLCRWARWRRCREWRGAGGCHGRQRCRPGARRRRRRVVLNGGARRRDRHVRLGQARYACDQPSPLRRIQFRFVSQCSRPYRLGGAGRGGNAGSLRRRLLSCAGGCCVCCLGLAEADVEPVRGAREHLCTRAGANVHRADDLGRPQCSGQREQPARCEFDERIGPIVATDRSRRSAPRS